MTEYNPATLKREILEGEGQGLQGPNGWLSVLRRCLPQGWTKFDFFFSRRSAIFHTDLAE
jgi:hypothetical protein